MIPAANVRQWRLQAPWLLDSQVEQDLVLSRALIDVFRQPFLCKELAFRGGTALNKLFLRPAARYSEDIDLVRTTRGPIANLINTLREQLDPWLGTPKYTRSYGRYTLIYRFQTSIEPTSPMRLKLEINTRLQFSFLDLEYKQFEIENPWYSGKCEIPTYTLEEQLATKFCALYVSDP